MATRGGLCSNASQKLFGQNLVHHSSPKVRHVSLKKIQKEQKGNCQVEGASTATMF